MTPSTPAATPGTATPGTATPTAARRRAVALLLAALVGLAAACSGDDTGGGAGTTGSIAPGTGSGDGPIEIKDGTGRVVELDGPAQRVVVLEWVYAEDLMALGVTPVGVADVAGYAGWVSRPALPEGTTDVGTRQEPSTERLLALDPDLIVTASFRHETILDQLEGIAPTLLFNPYPDTGEQLEEMRTTFATLARAVGREAEGTAVLADLDAHAEELSDRLEGAGLAGTAVALAQGAVVQGTPNLRLFTDEAMVVGLMRQLGLTNAWTGQREEFGFNTVDLEGLATLPDDAHLLTIAQPVSDPFADLFPGNPVWDGMPLVREGRVHDLGGDTWTFGGPVSAEVFLDRVVQALGA